jgi:hypothetical protein
VGGLGRAFSASSTVADIPPAMLLCARQKRRESRHRHEKRDEIGRDGKRWEKRERGKGKVKKKRSMRRMSL